MTPLERLAARSERRGECLVWTGPTDKKGYGLIKVGGRSRRVHRLAWSERHGEIPPSLFVLHHCDNPPCWADDHLFLGTHADNMRDMVAKGRGRNHVPSAREVCVNGHELTPENTYTWPDGKRRACRTCRRAHHEKRTND